MADLRIVDAPDLPLEELTGEVKIPTGGKGNYAVKAGDVATFVEQSKDLANKTFVNSSSNGVKALLDAHKNDKENPHSVTKAQIGLGNVDNTADLDKPVSNATSATITTAVNSSSNGVKALLEAHTNNVNNPHGVTKAQIGLGNVDNTTDLDKPVSDATSSAIITAISALGTASEYDVEDLPVTQKQRDELVGAVESVADLIAIQNPQNGQTVYVKSHFPDLLLGAGVYQFEQLSKKTPNNGAWVGAVGGVWVLVSPLHFENFGVVNDGTDQSTKIQACIDFADSQNIYSYGFEKPNTYCLSKSIVFKPYLSSSVSTFYSAEKRLKITTNGAKLKPLAPIVMVKIHREHVSFDSLEGYAPWASVVIGATLLRLGLHDDPEYPPEYRRGASFFSVGSLIATNINAGVQFCPSSSNPAGNTYGAYYHNFTEIIYRNVKYGLLLDLAIDGKNQTTRCSIGSYKHNGGSCAFLGLNVETFSIDSFYTENLNAESTEYPLASNRAVYIPKKPSNATTFSNHTVKITGSCEDVPYPIFCEASNCEINIVPANFRTGDQKSLVGNYNSGYGGTGVMSGCTDLNEFTFPYQTSRSATVNIQAGSVGVASLPAGMTECYGNIQYLVTSSSMSIEGVQVFHSIYPVVGVFIRKASGVAPVFGAWSRIDKNTSLLRHSSVTDVNANTLKIDGERVTYGASFSLAQGVALNSPTGGEFYGAIEWIPSVGSQGVQMAYGTYPDVVKKRNFSTAWSVWKTIALT